jgi:hypothetical protein
LGRVFLLACRGASKADSRCWHMTSPRNSGGVYTRTFLGNSFLECSVSIAFTLHLPQTSRAFLKRGSLYNHVPLCDMITCTFDTMEVIRTSLCLSSIAKRQLLIVNHAAEETVNFEEERILLE